MTKIIELNQIQAIIHDKENRIIDEIEKGFIEYSQDKTVVPPVGELSFDKPPGDVHIKYGFKDAKAITTNDLTELGRLIANTNLHRSSDEQITIADLTGVAVQDIQISKLVYEASLS